MQKGNWIIFGVLAIVIFFGWMQVQNTIWPPKKKDDAALKDKDKKVTPVKLDTRVAMDIALVSAPIGGSDALGLLAFAVWEPRPPEKLIDPELARYMGLSLTASLVGASDPFSGLFWVDVGSPRLRSLATLGRLPEVTETIGGDGFFIEAKLTNRGAGVQHLMLTQFEAANYLGKRAPGKLELIQEDPFVPSFLMYHYPDPEAKPSDPPDALRPPLLTLGVANWKLEGKTTLPDGTQRVVFSTPLDDPGYKDIFITKTYELAPKAYHLGLIIELENRGAADVKKVRYQLAGSHGMPVEGEWYAPVSRDSLIGLVNQRGYVDRNRQDAATISFRKGGTHYPDASGGEYFLRYAGVAVQFFASVIVVSDRQDDLGKTAGNGILAWARPTLESTEMAGYVGEYDLENEVMFFFDSNKKPGPPYRLLPRTAKHIAETKLKPGAKAVISYYETFDHEGRPLKVATWIRPGNTPRDTFNDISVRVNSEPVELAPGKKVSHRFLLYHGPVKTRLLGQFGGDKAVPSELVARYTDELSLYTLTDYRSDGFFGWLSQKIMFTNLLIFVTNLMHTLLYWLHFLVGGYGLAIILLTVLVRGLMFPISRKQALFSIKMQALAPELRKLQEKYKGNPREKTQATMEFYRKHKINPFASCLPLLMQMPIFLGLYFALQESIHFRLAGFLWIDNLAAPDMLVYWSQSIPWVSDPDNVGGMLYLGPYFNLLPICAVLLMVVQQQMMAPPALDEQQAMQMKVMKFMMIFIGIMFYKVAAGLALYFIASSLWGVAERKILPKKTLEPALQPTPLKGGPPPKGMPSSKGGQGKGKQAPKEEPTGAFARLKKWWHDVLEQAKKK